MQQPRCQQRYRFLNLILCGPDLALHDGKDVGGLNAEDRASLTVPVGKVFGALPGALLYHKHRADQVAVGGVARDVLHMFSIQLADDVPVGCCCRS